MKHIHFSRRIFFYLFSVVFLFTLCACSQTEGNYEIPSSISGTTETPNNTYTSDAMSSDEPRNLSSGENPASESEQTTIPSNALTSDAANESSSGNPSAASTPAITPGNEHMESPVPIKTATLDTSSPSNAYKSVLLDNAEFYSTDYKENVTISKLTEPISTDIPVKIWRFTVIDLDCDGTPEVILWLVRNMDIDLSFEILRYDGGVVRQYGITPRGFSDLKADGTFLSSGGAGDWGFCTISFGKSLYDTDKFTFCESFLTSANNPGELYYVNHESVFEDDFWIAVDQQNAKLDAVWYDFTETNIETLLNK